MVIALSDKKLNSFIFGKQIDRNFSNILKGSKAENNQKVRKQFS